MDTGCVVIEGPLKLYEESTYMWILSEFSEEGKKLQNGKSLSSRVFSTRRKEWLGRLNIFTADDYSSVTLVMDAAAGTHIKSKLLLLNQRDKVLQETREIETVFKVKRNYGLFYIEVASLPTNIVSFIEGFEILKIKVIIQKEVSLLEFQNSGGGSLTTSETNSAEEIIHENKNLKKDLQKMLENKEFSDFVIKLNDSSEIPVHKSILAARSAVFSAMLKNDSSEKNEAYVNIIDIDKDTMMMLLNYIYTENLPSDLSVAKALTLLSAADKYDISDLKEFCCNYLKRNLDITNAIDILLIVELHNITEIKSCVFDLILNNKERFSDPVMLERIGKKFPNLLPELIMKMFKGKT